MINRFDMRVRYLTTTCFVYPSMSSGVTVVLYDPRMSVKGATRTAGKAPKREKDPSDYAITPEIYNPHALKMYRVNHSSSLFYNPINFHLLQSNPMDARRAKAEARKDPIRSKIPEKPIKGTNATNTSFFFTQYVMNGREKSGIGNEDPREALLKMDEKAKADPIFLGPAYKRNQPDVLLHDKTFEEESEEFNLKKRRL